MKSLSANLIKEKNLISGTHPWLILLDVEIDESETIYIVRNVDDITFDGQLYTAFPFEIDPIKFMNTGEISTVQIRVCNITRTIQGYLEENDGLIGNSVTLRVVNEGFLAENYAELTMTFQILSCTADASWVSFSCGMPNPMNRRFPLYRYIGSYCNWQFKSAECAYTGAITTCKRTLVDCQAKSNSSRFGGNPGLGFGGVRIA